MDPGTLPASSLWSLLWGLPPAAHWSRWLPPLTRQGTLHKASAHNILSLHTHGGPCAATGMPGAHKADAIPAPVELTPHGETDSSN